VRDWYFMNIFAVDKDPSVAAKMLCDRHVSKKEYVSDIISELKFLDVELNYFGGAR
jgi:hypothetical protein